MQIKIKFKKIEWGLFREILIYSFWIFLNIIMDRIYWSTGQFVLAATSGTIAVAVYAVAVQLQTLYLSFSGGVSSVFLPRVTAMVTSGCNNSEVSDLFIRIGRLQYIVMAFILSGFIVFGYAFVVLWAGNDYSQAYLIALIFFIPLTIPLIQNLGIIILQARNQMRFRSIVYVIIAICSLFLQIFLAKYYGGVGCAIAVAVALTAGQIIVMNIYYQKKQGIDILKFWREIIKMTIIPAILCISSLLILQHVEVNTTITLAIGILSFTLVYIPLFWLFSMNRYEKDLVLKPVNKLLKRSA